MLVQFTYRNHRGETRPRRVEFIGLEFNHSPGYNYQPGWFLRGRDIETDEVRSFALTHIVLPEDKLFFLTPA